MGHKDLLTNNELPKQQANLMLSAAATCWGHKEIMIYNFG